MSEPIPVMVRRYDCPHCGHRRATKRTVVEHIGRCWRNPEARGCLTCRHYSPGDYPEPEVGYPGSDESCDQGISLAGTPACGVCHGQGLVQADEYGVNPCPECDGSDAEPGEPGCREVKPGPITGCHEWEASDAAKAPLGASEES